MPSRTTDEDKCLIASIDRVRERLADLTATSDENDSGASVRSSVCRHNDSEALQEVSRNMADPGAGRPRRVPEAFLC